MRSASSPCCANAAAALATSGFGAVAPLPRLDEVRALLVEAA